MALHTVELAEAFMLLLSTLERSKAGPSAILLPIRLTYAPAHQQSSYALLCVLLTVADGVCTILLPPLWAFLASMSCNCHSRLPPSPNPSCICVLRPWYCTTCTGFFCVSLPCQQIRMETTEHLLVVTSKLRTLLHALDAQDLREKTIMVLYSSFVMSSAILLACGFLPVHHQIFGCWNRLLHVCRKPSSTCIAQQLANTHWATPATLPGRLQSEWEGCPGSSLFSFTAVCS